MSDLEAFRDHARQMAAMTKSSIQRRAKAVLGEDGLWHAVDVVTPVPTDAERAMWVRLASEIDAYLATAEHDSEDDEMLPMEDA